MCLLSKNNPITVSISKVCMEFWIILTKLMGEIRKSSGMGMAPNLALDSWQLGLNWSRMMSTLDYFNPGHLDGYSSRF